MTRDDQAFIAAIIANPADDLPRLVYADWLDDRGDPRGEFIRVQVELAGLEVVADQFRVIDILRDGYGPTLRRRDALRRRERELFHAASGGWIEAMPRCTYNLVDTMSTSPRGDPWFVVRRGFPEHLAASWEQFARYADELRAATPLRKVRLTTRPRVTGRDDEPNRTTTFTLDDRPEVSHLMTREAMLSARNAEGVADVVWSKLLAEAFPGVEFELPPEMRAGIYFVDVQIPVTNPRRMFVSSLTGE